MTVRLELPFTITTWDVVADTAPTDEGAPDTGRVVLAKTYAGDDLNGTATGHALMTRGDKGASYVAQERIVGTLRGHWGSFVLEHGASMGEGQETEMRAVDRRRIGHRCAGRDLRDRAWSSTSCSPSRWSSRTGDDRHVDGRPASGDETRRREVLAPPPSSRSQLLNSLPFAAT